MSESLLPDDPRGWPDDPCALFGVAPDVSKKDLRRAYAALIRRFKPEQSPEAFQKIREAYDVLRQRLSLWSWKHSSEIHEPTEEIPATPSGSPEMGDDGEGENAAVLLRSSHELVQREIRSAWDLAREGRWPEAYSKLSHLAQQHPASEEIAERLLWIRRLRPKLDHAARPDSTRSTTCAARVGDAESDSSTQAGSVPIADCLQEDFLERARKSLATAYSEEAELWWSAALPGWQGLRFLQARWSAAASHGAFDRIGVDLHLSRVIFADDREVWYQVLVLALELSHLSSRDDAVLLRNSALELLRPLRDLDLRFSHALDRADLLREYLHRLTLRNGKDDPLTVLAFKEFVGASFDTRQEVAELVQEWLHNPEKAFRHICGMAYNLRPVLLDVIKRYAASRGCCFDPPDSAWLEARLRATPALLAHFHWLMANFQTYDSDRLYTHLMAFCLRERVLPLAAMEELGRMFGEGRKDYMFSCRNIGGDSAMTAVITACLAFWNTDDGEGLN